MGTQPFHPPSPGTTFAVWGPLAVPSFAANTQAECNAQAQLAFAGSCLSCSPARTLSTRRSPVCLAGEVPGRTRFEEELLILESLGEPRGSRSFGRIGFCWFGGLGHPEDAILEGLGSSSTCPIGDPTATLSEGTIGPPPFYIKVFRHVDPSETTGPRAKPRQVI